MHTTNITDLTAARVWVKPLFYPGIFVKIIAYLTTFEKIQFFLFGVKYDKKTKYIRKQKITREFV